MSQVQTIHQVPTSLNGSRHTDHVFENEEVKSDKQFSKIKLFLKLHQKFLLYERVQYANTVQ